MTRPIVDLNHYKLEHLQTYIVADLRKITRQPVANPLKKVDLLSRPIDEGELSKLAEVKNPS